MEICTNLESAQGLIRKERQAYLEVEERDISPLYLKDLGKEGGVRTVHVTDLPCAYGKRVLLLQQYAGAVRLEFGGFYLRVNRNGTVLLELGDLFSFYANSLHTQVWVRERFYEWVNPLKREVFIGDNNANNREDVRN